ncbi:MAG TPA: VOC family protein [Candidatus Saccharimonadales bacterium]|nr:VOC family protein [Candidatus Saccharimonadales bacterium]
MLENSDAFSGFATSNIAAAKEFYGSVLSLNITEQNGMLTLHFSNGGSVLIYPKPDHKPADFTILNFPVPNIDETVEALLKKGVQFEHYDEGQLKTDEKGIARGLATGMGPDIAWFTDPAGNILSVLQNS